jgi:hypothetical protein
MPFPLTLALCALPLRTLPLWLSGLWLRRRLPASITLLRRRLLLAHLPRRRSDLAWRLLNSLAQLLLTTLLLSLSLRLPLRFCLLLYGGALLLLLRGN